MVTELQTGRRVIYAVPLTASPSRAAFVWPPARMTTASFTPHAVSLGGGDVGNGPKHARLEEKGVSLEEKWSRALPQVGSLKGDPSGRDGVVRLLGRPVGRGLEIRGSLHR